MTSNASSDITATLQQALSLHQQGQFAAAEARYRQVLQLQPLHFDALHLLGVLARQSGQPQQAIELIGRALAVDSRQAIAFCNMGAALQDLDRPEEALQYYDGALGLNPHYALALNNRGNALRKLRRLDDALQSYQQALHIKLDYPEAFYNQGTVLHQLQRLEDALESYEHALRLKPDYADAWCNHGLALQELRRHEEAIASYDSALQLNPRHANAHCNRGTALRSLNRYEEALNSYETALQIKPDFADAHLFRGNILRSLERFEEAAISYRRALEHGGNPEHIRYALAALGEGTAPAIAPAGYVKELFDQYADHFDRHLLEVLQYQTPTMLVELLLTAWRANGASELCDTVDLGCGTGLCGPLLRPMSRTLCGVDLSPNMLEKARQRQVYDQLACDELSAYLQCNASRYDVALAADVFVYIGDLSAVFHGVRAALRPGGLFAFSLEGSDGEDFVLRPSRRFAHSESYVQRLALASGFVLEKIERRTLRHDDGIEIKGFLVILRCAS
jgi:predicted TPR repeat methyltransferase